MRFHAGPGHAPLPYSQAVDDRPAFPFLTFLLPFFHLQYQFQKRAFGAGHFPMRSPSEVLELLYHQITLLWLERKAGLYGHQDKTTKDIYSGWSLADDNSDAFTETFQVV